MSVSIMLSIFSASASTHIFSGSSLPMSSFASWSDGKYPGGTWKPVHHRTLAALSSEPSAARTPAAATLIERR
jgi:hypothetical protein